MAPGYPIHWPTIAGICWNLLTDRPRSFRADSLALVGHLRAYLHVEGADPAPLDRGLLLTVNHYSRPGFRAWWLALVISALLPGEIHWIITSAWTYPDSLRRRIVTPLTRLLFTRVASIYGFTCMPPMPPVSHETQARARSIRRVLAFVKQADNPIIGLAPEGRDIEHRSLGLPPPGSGRFIAHLTRLGLDILPVGFYEDGDFIGVRFGTPYYLELPDHLNTKELDAYASTVVMHHIAALLPIRLRRDNVMLTS